MAENFNPILTDLGGEKGFGDLVPGLDTRSDDDSSDELNLPFAPNFFGETYNTFFVNNNGNITFNAALSGYTPQSFPIAAQPLIGVYWADVDTRNEDSGLVYLAAPNEDTIVVTWDNVGYFENHADLLNTFQLVLRDRSDDTGSPGDFDIEFRYKPLVWTTGDASDGQNGLGGIPAQAGFDAGNLEDFFSLPGSFTEEILNLQNTSNVSTETPGLWNFPIRSGGVPGQSPTNPIIPVITDEGFEFDFNIQDPNKRIWIDPTIAIGYDYIVNSGPNISTVEIPIDVTGSDGVYDLFFPNQNGILVDSNLNIGVNEEFSFIDNGFPEGVSTFGIRGIDQGAQLDPNNPQAFVTGLQFTSNGPINLNQNPITIVVDENQTSLLNTPINRFQNSDRSGTYLFVGEQESVSVRQNFSNFIEEGEAFKVAVEPGDDLIAMNRFQNSSVPGTYLYAGEEESVGIRENFANFLEEGVAFYVYSGDAGKGIDFYRFQNSQQPGTYLFVGEEERQNIIANFPNFVEEGVAFEVSI